MRVHEHQEYAAGDFVQHQNLLLHEWQQAGKHTNTGLGMVTFRFAADIALLYKALKFWGAIEWEIDIRITQNWCHILWNVLIRNM